MLKIENGNVILQNKFGKYTGCIRKSGDYFYFEGFTCGNAAPLKDAGFTYRSEMKKLWQNLLGYHIDGGLWPWCKTKGDVIIILRYLDGNRNNIIPLKIFV